MRHHFGRTSHPHVPPSKLVLQPRVDPLHHGPLLVSVLFGPTQFGLPLALSLRIGHLSCRDWAAAKRSSEVIVAGLIEKLRPVSGAVVSITCMEVDYDAGGCLRSTASATARGRNV